MHARALAADRGRRPRISTGDTLALNKHAKKARSRRTTTCQQVQRYNVYRNAKAQNPLSVEVNRLSGVATCLII